jgi:hypothetical protein
MNLLKKTSFLACVLLATQLVCSQEALLVSTGEASESGGSVSYTVGQVFYTTNTAATGGVSQGVQHSFEFQTLSSPELTTLKVTAVTYPNPTKDFIILKIMERAMHNLRYPLFDVTGKAISNGIITNGDSQIAM